MRAAASRDLARHELAPAARRLVVEQDPRHREQAVALAVVHRDPVAVDLGDRVGAARVERRRLVLRRLAHLAEHLGARRLVEADLGIDQAHRVEHARDAERGELAGERRLQPAGRHERLRRQVVDLGGPHLAQQASPASSGRAGRPGGASTRPRRCAIRSKRLGARAAHHAVHLVALLEQQLGQVRAVLAGDAGDQRAARLTASPRSASRRELARAPSPGCVEARRGSRAGAASARSRRARKSAADDALGGA